LNFDPTWALAALRVENRGSKKKNVDLMEAMNRLRDQLGARKTSLYLKVIRVRIFKVNIQICKHINALALLLQRRLILEPTSKQFDMTKLIQSTSQSVYKKLPIN
jgi:hypothetical protein